MALNKGLRAHRESQEQKTKFFKLKDGEKVFIRPLVELDDDAKNFNPSQGLALFTKEWQNPEDFTRQIVDTMDEEGACVGQELLRKFGWNGDQNGGRGPKIVNGKEFPGPDTWRPKDYMYLPCVVRTDKDSAEDEKVIVFKFNMAPKAVQGPFFEEQHNNNKTITDRWYAYSRSGEGQYDTNYKVAALDPTPKDKFDPSAYEMPDLEAQTPYVEYSKQRAALGLRDESELVGATTTPASGSALDSDW